MERNISTDAVVIANTRSGERNREISLFSPDYGVMRVLVYGGQKSHKASCPPLFSIGKFFLTSNPLRNSYSFNDVKYIPLCPFDFTLKQIGIASFICELGKEVGESDHISTYRLISTALILLSASSDLIRENSILIQFVWQLMKSAGLVSDLSRCPVCGTEYSGTQVLFYSNAVNFFCCQRCTEERALFIGPGAQRYLSLTLEMELLDAVEVPLNEATANRLRRLMIAYSMNVCGRKLKTVQSGLV